MNMNWNCFILLSGQEPVPRPRSRRGDNFLCPTGKSLLVSRSKYLDLKAPDPVLSTTRELTPG